MSNMYLCTYIHTHTYIHTYTYVHAYIHIVHSYIIHTYAHTYTHTHTYIHTYIHTYTHIHTYTLFLEIIHENLKFFAASMYFDIEDQTENNFTKIDAIPQSAKDGRMLIATQQFTIKDLARLGNNPRDKTWKNTYQANNSI